MPAHRRCNPDDAANLQSASVVPLEGETLLRVAYIRKNREENVTKRLFSGLLVALNNVDKTVDCIHSVKDAGFSDNPFALPIKTQAVVTVSNPKWKVVETASTSSGHNSSLGFFSE